MSKYVLHVYRQKKQELNQVHNKKMFEKKNMNMYVLLKPVDS